MNSLDEIKHYIIQNFKLEEIIKEDSDIKKSGSRLTACCPFHEENTPSFYIFSDHYHCFGCKAHGDVINYVREKRGLGFLDAIEFLGGKLGIDTSPIRGNKKERARWESKSRQTSAYQLAQKFFTQQLFSHFGKSAYKYILSRGYTHEQVKEFGFGFSLSSPNALAKHLIGRGFTKKELEEYSLINLNGEEAYDFFRARLMIPIKDISGKPIAFAGRTLGDSPQKYKNSRYEKKDFLFGLDHAHKAIRKTGRAIVVEGYLDAIRLWSLGLHEVVACQGTSLTIQHMTQLKSLSKQVYVLFDGDKAGKSSALRLVSDTQKTPGVAFYFSELPDGYDPDSYTEKFGVPSLRELLEKSPPLIEFVIRERFKQTPEQRTPELLRNEIIPWIKETIDPLQRAYFLKKVSQLSGINEEILNRELNQKEAVNFLKPKKKKNPLPLPKKNFKLKPYVKDLFGHLYFADPSDELNISQLEEIHNGKLELPEPWHYFLEELISNLKKGEEPSYKKENHSWVSSHSPEITDFLLGIQKNKEAFTSSQRTHEIEKLMLLHEKELIKGKIKTLKSEVQKQTLEPGKNCDIRVLMEINELYKKLTLFPDKSY